MREKYQCPVCGYYTIEDEYDICQVCYWEDDRLAAFYPNYGSGANGPSLISARIYYKEHGVCSIMDTGAVRPPLEEEKQGDLYPFREYYYDDKRRILYFRAWRGKLCVVSDRYGSPLDGAMSDDLKKYRLITARIAAGGETGSKWQKILDKGVREYVEPWHSDEDFLLDDDHDIFEEVIYKCTVKYKRISPSLRRLQFWEYTKKLATRDFKDVMLCLNDELLAQFESVCGHSVFEVLEMDDDECAAIFKKLCEFDENSEQFAKMLQFFTQADPELRWDVPEWMATWG